jgi:L-fuconolactonase
MPTPRLDSHQHFWRYTAADYGWIDDTMAVLRRDFLPVDLKPVLDQTGQDGCIAVQARQSEAETRWLLRLADEAPWIRAVVGWVDLALAEVADRLDALRHERLRGIRHVLQAEPDDYSRSSAFRRGLAELARRGLVYDLLVYAPQLPVAIELVRAFPDQAFVLDHMGKPRVRAGEHSTWARDLLVLASLPNVACKLSGLVTEAEWRTWTNASLRPYFETVLEAFGPKRLMFGSDWPVCLSAATYARWHQVAAAWTGPLSASERAAIEGGTAATWYRLPQA